MGSLLKRYKARPFQSFARPEGGAQRPRGQKSRLIYQLIEMKLGMSNYDHKSIPMQNLSLVAILVLEI